jgi:chromosome segregation ATPase
VARAAIGPIIKQHEQGADLRRRLAAVETERDQLRAELRAARDRRRRMRARLRAAQTTVEQQRKRLRRLDAAAAEWLHEMDALRSELAAARRGLERRDPERK